jgi:mono/diheme cytochrome c family protein
MNPKTIIAFLITTLVLATAAWRVGTAERAQASAGERARVPELGMTRVERGEYLVTSVGCGDCHTPMKLGPSGPEPDMTRMLSGHPQSLQLPPAPAAQDPWAISASATMTAWSGPWGTSFTANLTPDDETGTGAWSEENFVQTIRKGRHMGSGRPLLPPMPIPAYVNFSDEDLKSIYAYLRTIPAVNNRVPQPLPPAPRAQ